jgi:hypothetical protein
MNELTIILLVLVGCGGIWLMKRVWGRYLAERRAFNARRKELKSLRLTKMLEYLGVDLTDYLRKVPVSDVEQHMSRCKKCKNTEICDACLRDGKQVANMHFCPNYQSLTLHSKTFAKRSSFNQRGR